MNVVRTSSGRDGNEIYLPIDAQRSENTFFYTNKAFLSKVARSIRPRPVLLFSQGGLGLSENEFGVKGA